MKAAPAGSRILVSTDNADDARQIVKQLSHVFDDVRSSTVADDATADFEACRPQVLVLAFDTIAKAQQYYLGLYRMGAGAIHEPHRTIILCGKDEVRAAFDLCRADYFDDYVLYWPQAYDGSRLAMSIWIAARQMAGTASALPTPAELLLHARHLADLETAISDPVEGASEALRSRLAPALAGTRPLADASRKIRPLVLVIDDDDLSRRMAQHAIDPQRWEVAIAVDSAGALGQLRSLRPDVILMDVRLPGMDGVALTRHLKASPLLRGIPVVMMTGDARRETLLSSMEAGAAAFVVKPVTRVALDAKLDKIVPR
jgi:CheY-like chemotaxis protein